jgi:predicted dehydrogenase
MTMRIAIIGAGYMAAEHARAFAAQADTQIVGVVSRTRERAEALAEPYGATVFGSIESLWRETRADAVVVAVSELAMAEVCTAVFRHPWACLLEKPVGVDLADARSIQQSANRSGARVWVALNRRSHASTRAALARIESTGSRLVSVLDQQDMESLRSLGTPEAVVRNYMFVNSIHVIDYFQVFCRGSLTSVDVIAPWTPEDPAHVIASLQWSSGDRGVYQALWNGPGPWAVTVATQAARFEMRPLESLTVQLRGERRVTAVEPDPVDTDFKPGLYRQAAEFIKATKGGDNELATLDQATESMQMCAAIYGLA